eukprot:scaffold27318_cov98-Isochrysis_galbana.AAC.2
MWGPPPYPGVVGEGSFVGGAAFGAPIDEAAGGGILRIAHCSAVLPKAMQWPIGAGALPPGYEPSPLVKTITPTVVITITPEFGRVDDVRGVEVGGFLGRAFIAKEDGANGNGGDGLVERVIDRVVAFVVLAPVGHRVTKVVDVEAPAAW